MTMMSRIAEGVSAISVRPDGSLTPLGVAVLGNDVRLLSTRWYRSPTSPQDVPSWATFADDTAVLPFPWPRLYRSVGRIIVNGSAFAESREAAGFGARPVLAWLFDERTILTALLREKPGSETHAYPKNEDVAPADVYVRIGHRDVSFSVGHQDPRGNLHVSIGAVTTGGLHDLSSRSACSVNFY